MTRPSTRPEFGLFVYSQTENLGDEIQSLAAMQFIGPHWAPINRDEIAATPHLSSLKFIGNGWFLHDPLQWPPPEDTRMLCASMHISKRPGRCHPVLTASDVMLGPKHRHFLKDREPIGARDLATMHALEQAGIHSYLSGCLTLTLKRPSNRRDRDLIVLNDVPSSIVEHVRSNIFSSKIITIVTHYETEAAGQSIRFERAERLLELYSRASCVITTRLHCALPCVAFGVPVLMLKGIVPDQERFTGLSDLYTNLTVAEFLRDIRLFDINNAPPNPERDRQMTNDLRRAAEAFCRP